MGKTVITLSAIADLEYNRFAVSRVLIVAPKKVAEATWQKEAAKWDHLRRLRFAAVLGSEPKRIRALNTPADIWVINRENIPWLVEYYRNAWPFDMVVLDESSSFKNHQAKRFKSLTWVRHSIRRMVALTGTPAPNGLLDLWAQISLKVSRGRGIINHGSDTMGVDITIDELTPCLVESTTGRIVQTAFSVASQKELKNLKKQGWLFDWSDEALKQDEIYKLTVIGSEDIQGLIALKYEERSQAVYAHIAESAPVNRGAGKKYYGVGGHLFAIAAKKSFDKGYGGFVFLDAKNRELVSHYRDALGAVLLGMPHPYRMVIDEEAAVKLLEKYTL